MAQTLSDTEAENVPHSLINKYGLNTNTKLFGLKLNVE